MAKTVQIFQASEDGLGLEIAGELIVHDSGKQEFSQRTPPELVKQFTCDGLPLPRWVTLRGFWARLWSMIKGKTIRVWPDDPFFPKALEFYNDNIFRRCYPPDIATQSVS